MLIEHLSNCDANIIVFNGDLLDSARPSIEEIGAVLKALNKLKHKEVIINVGNHEAVSLNKSTYDILNIPTADYVISVGNLTIGIIGWLKRDTLQNHKGTDIIISHYRSEMKGLYEAEIDTSFTVNHDLVILGDIHDRYSPSPNSHYTGSPYPTHYTKSNKAYGYIELSINGYDFDWKYVDLDLPKKIRLDVDFKDILSLDIEPQHLYKIYVTGTLDELSNLHNTENIIYQKDITTPEVVEQVQALPDLNFIDNLTTQVEDRLATKLDNVKTILLNIQGDS